jgi:transposase InsO family protein
LKQVFAFIQQEAQNFAAKTLCRVLMVSKSAYYGFLKRDAGPHSSQAVSFVREVFSRHSRRYGSRRIHAEMKAEGKVMGRHKIRRIMREHGLRAIQPKRFVPRTTDSGHGKRMSPNLLLERRQPPSRPGEVVVGDITYLPLASGSWAYLATWEDLYSRMIVGWQVEGTLEEKLVIGAMQKAILRRRPKKGLIVHSDRGGQYVGEAFRRLLELHGYQQSMSRAGESYDNAYAESLFSRYKAELLEEGVFADVEEARMETFNYIEGYYNRIRRHSALGYISPEEFERKYYREVEDILTANQRKE